MTWYTRSSDVLQDINLFQSTYNIMTTIIIDNSNIKKFYT